MYEVWWVLYPGNIFLVDLYHETLGPGVSMGSYPFPLGINFFLVSMQNPIFLVARDQASIPGVNRVLSPKKLWMFFVCQQKFSEQHNFFFDRWKRLLVVQILEVTVYHENAEHIRLITSTANWESRNGGDLFGRAKIDTPKSCIQLLQVVLLYRGHLYKELCPGIFRYSKEWKSVTIDILPKSA